MKQSSSRLAETDKPVGTNPFLPCRLRALLKIEKKDNYLIKSTEKMFSYHFSLLNFFLANELEMTHVDFEEAITNIVRKTAII